MKMSPHFSRAEFICRCGCDFDTVDADLLRVLEDLRIRFDAPITINSAARCVKHNAFVGGGVKSQHLFGKAADIVVKGEDPDTVYAYLDAMYPNKYGIGRYPGKEFVHVDTRSTKARWTG